MKVALIILSMLLSSAAFSMEGSLSFNDNMEVKKVVMMDEIEGSDFCRDDFQASLRIQKRHTY